MYYTLIKNFNHLNNKHIIKNKEVFYFKFKILNIFHFK